MDLVFEHTIYSVLAVLQIDKKWRYIIYCPSDKPPRLSLCIYVFDHEFSVKEIKVRMRPTGTGVDICMNCVFFCKNKRRENKKTFKNRAR